MASYEETAKTAFTVARVFYTGEEKDAEGNKTSITTKMKCKSSNKWNTKGSSLESIRQKEANNIIGDHRKNNHLYGVDNGKHLFNSDMGGGNCGELADVAAYIAWKELGAARPCQNIALISLAAPGDHVFCAVGEHSAIQKLNGKKIEDIPNVIGYSDDLWAVDPWLNIYSMMKNYPVAAEEKLKKWHQKGKRIGWAGPTGKEKGWYPPDGDYSKFFLAGVMAGRLAAP